MSKSTTDPEAVVSAEAPTAIPIVYLDARYASRKLVLPSGRTAAVKAKRITVQADDTELTGYLDAHADFTRQE